MSPGGIQHHWQVWTQAWRHRQQMDGEHRLNHELAFLPAALEVQETPPSPLGRIIIWIIVAFFVAALIWACVGHVDIVAVAHGKLIPLGKSKVIQPLEAGVVTEIHVQEGQRVTRGDRLIDLDSTISQAEVQRLRGEWMTAEASRARLAALLDALETQDAAATPELVALPDIDTAIVNAQAELMRNQYAAHRARDRALVGEIDKKHAEQAVLREDIAKHQAIIPLITQRTQSLQHLSEQKLAAQNDFLELEQQRIEQVQDLAILENRDREIQRAIAQIEAQRDSLRAEFIKTLNTEQVERESRAAGLKQELIKAETRTGRQHLTSPVDGVVQQLAVHTLGGVVTPAQALMVIVPSAQRLEVEAWIQNKDIGFIEQGQKAEIKVDAFPFTKYGTLDGEIMNLSNDAVENEHLGWVFSSRVRMAASSITVAGKQVNLTPGMSVSVEVKTGKRRLIEFFLSPLLRYSQESAKER